MAKRLRIPGLIDLLRTDAPDAILTLAADPRLDRRFDAAGPLFNRILAGRIRRVLQVGGAPLPPVAPRDFPGRAERQAALEAALDLSSGRAPADDAHLDALADQLLGRRPPEELGPLAQETVGRLFAADYRATPESWEAARLLDAAVRSRNPVRQLVWLAGGRVKRARRLLADGVAGDPAGLHTTGIAVHNLVRALERMRGLAAETHPRRLAAEAAVARCLDAPEGVLRQAVAQGTNAAGSFRPGTLVLFGLQAAYARSLRRDIAFMTGGWSRCPAHGWVPALLTAIWDRARARSGGEDHP